MPRTLTALYDTKASAEAARDRLIGTGLSASEIDVQDQGTYGSQGATSQKGGMMASLKGMFGAHEDHSAYAEGLNRGHVLLSATVQDAEVDKAIDILEGSDAIDLEGSQAEWRNAGWTGAAAASTTGDDVIQLAEERLVVGKREVERGGVRVRSYIVSTPVSEQVTLREETVGIERRPVDRTVAAGEDAFRDRTIEMRETGEEAVAAKQAVVTEEIALRKDVGQRTEEVRDTVRHTEVEVERVGGQTTTGAPDTRRI